MKNDYYTLIKNKLINNEIFERVKDYSKERNRVTTYYEIGRLLFEAGSKYGEDVIGTFAIELTKDLGKTYTKRTLRRYRQFYNMFKNRKRSALPTQLTWSHIQELLPINNDDEINYYVGVCINQRITFRELRERIKSKEYYRLPEETRNKLINNAKLDIKDTIRDPIIIRTNRDIINEKVLQQVILENISKFLKDLGDGFTFIDNEYKIKIDNRYNYIDLLLYNYIYNCFVVIELKMTEARKEHIGQIEVYMNYIDKNIKSINQNNTLGIILCKKNNELIVKYSSNDNIISREYVIAYY